MERIATAKVLRQDLRLDWSLGTQIHSHAIGGWLIHAQPDGFVALKKDEKITQSLEWLLAGLLSRHD